MSKYLRDLSFELPSQEERGVEFALSTNFLELLYLDSLPKVESGGVAKVVIAPCRNEPAQSVELLISPNVYRVWKKFDFDAYWKSGMEQRKQLALELMQDGLMQIAKAKRWKTAPFIKAYQRILEINFVSYRPWGNAVTSPDRRYKAQIWCDYDSEKADLYIVIFLKKQVVKRKLVATVKPGDVWIRDGVGKLEWESKNRVRTMSNGSLQFCEVEPAAER